MGRFCSRDPIGYRAGVNLAEYVWDSPTRWTDPSGTQYFPWPIPVSPTPPDTGRGRGLGGDLESDWAGRQLLWWWLTGGGAYRGIHDDPSWSSYMMRSELLRMTVRLEMTKEALDLCKKWDNVDIGTHLQFKAQVESGESITGYNYLGGTNPCFVVYGRAVIKHSNGKTGVACCNVAFDVRFSWRDIMDPNPAYESDNVKALFGEAISLGYAESYGITISWKGLPSISFDASGVPSGNGWPFK
ncbi:MAG: RHS repeat-associated core domain-containing protein [Pirellulaceae bacterium]